MSEFDCPNCGTNSDIDTLQKIKEIESDIGIQINYGGNCKTWVEVHKCRKCKNIFEINNCNY